MVYVGVTPLSVWPLSAATWSRPSGLLLLDGDPPERQSVAGFCAGDNAEASVATYESAEIVPQQQSARYPSGRFAFS